MKEDVSVLKEDVRILKEDVSTLKEGQQRQEGIWETLAARSIEQETILRKLVRV
ncbi:hypothetical protein ACI7RC_19425 [Brevibacillus sp. B_LB10_24]